jgi:hypothetical protein
MTFRKIASFATFYSLLRQRGPTEPLPPLSCPTRPLPPLSIPTKLIVPHPSLGWSDRSIFDENEVRDERFLTGERWSPPPQLRFSPFHTSAPPRRKLAIREAS